MAEEQNLNVQNTGDEVVKAIHASKSFVGHAVGALVLYYIGFYVIGLIANLLFLSSAQKTMKITGSSPPGRGCLLFLFWTHLVIPLIFVLGFLGVVSLPFMD